MAKANKEDYIHTDSGIGGQYKSWFLDYILIQSILTFNVE